MLRARGSVLLIAAIALALIATVGAAIYYAGLLELSTSLKTQPILTVESIQLFKNHGYVFFKAVLRNYGDYPVQVNATLYGEDGVVVCTFTNIIVPPKGIANLSCEGMYGWHFLVGEKYPLVVVGDYALIESIPCEGYQVTSKKIAIISPSTLNFEAIAGAPHIGVSNASEVVEGVLEVAKQLGIPVTTIASLEEWENLLQNPKPGMIFVNTLGGAAPAPSWALSNPIKYFWLLGKLIAEYGWTWVHVGGFPFYYLYDGKNLVQLGSSAVTLLFNTTKINIFGGSLEEVQEEILDESLGWGLKDLLQLAKMSPLPERLKFSYAFVLPPSQPPIIKYVFYANPSGSQSGAVSFSLGSGYYVHWGAPTDFYDDRGNAKIALILAIFTTVR